VDDSGRLSEEAIDRTVAALKDFRAVGDAAEARSWIAVATSAVRDAANSGELVDRVRREVGLQVRVIDGDAEARWAFTGAVSGLQVEDGWALDVGGGSMELLRFRAREAIGSRTLPLGGLRLSDRFLHGDPPSKEELAALREHVNRSLLTEGIGPLEGGERVVGTGGTIRNLAKMDRRRGPYPIPRLHGYVLTTKRLADLAVSLASRRLGRRRSLPGLNADRADSIVGGALAALTALEVLGGSEVIVSGQGLREGVALDALGQGPAPPEEVRRASIAALVGRFSSWSDQRARRRVLIAGRLLDLMDPQAGPRIRERIEQAATVLDIGTSIDFYERYRHASDIVTAADLAGFTHRKVALLAATLRNGDEEGMRTRDFAPLLGPGDADAVRRCGAILALADEIEHRTPPEAANGIRTRTRGKVAVLEAPIFDPWRRDALAARVKRAFGRTLVFEEGGPNGA
jgi:exopolyphosphatase/guanosine-5'-triphosphate,3'-diphosphate pyrophosphatase